MHSKSTLALILLAAAAGVWLWKGDTWGPKIGLKPGHTEQPASAAASVLDGLSTEGLSRIEVAISPEDQLVLERTAGGWRMPGNWPLRKAEVEQLVGTLGQLRTRFAPIPIASATDLTPYGLAADQKPIAVKLVSGKEPVSLTFGDPAPAPGETSFTRPAYVRVNDLPEVFQIGPDVMPILRRPAETYRRRQLFTDVERVKLAGGNALVPDPLGPSASEAATTVTLPGLETETIRVSGPSTRPRLFGIPVGTDDGTFTLTRIGKLPEPGVMARGEEPVTPAARLADAWALSAPVKDHVDPSRLRAVLSAVGDLWVDQFLSPAELDRMCDVRVESAWQIISACLTCTGPLAAGDLTAVAAAAEAAASTLPLKARTGLDDSRQSVTVRTKNGEPVTIRFGGYSKVVETEEAAPQPPPVPGLPPQPATRKIITPYRFARIDGNPQVFIVRADKLADLFTSVSRLKDTEVVRYAADDVWGLNIHRTAGPDVKLTRKKGNPRAIDPADQRDRWLLDATPNPLPADSERIRELLDIVAGLRADGADRVSYPSTAPAADTVITLTLRDRRADGELDAPARTITVDIGKPDVVKRLLPVWLQGWPRVTQLGDKFGPDDLSSWVISSFFPKTLSGLLHRPPVAYRGRKLFDTADASLTSVSVAASNGFALAKDGNGEWRLSLPSPSPADPANAEKMAASLSGLAATEYLADSPSPADLQAYGLDKPAQTVTLGFTTGRTYKLELGNPRPGKSEVFARLDGGTVFGLPTTAVEPFTAGALGLLPLRIWATMPDKVTGLEVTRTGEAAKQSFALTPDGTNWKLTGPFTAPVLFLNAQPLLTTLGSLQAAKYQAMSVGNAADYGLDKPVLKLKLSFKEKKPVPPGDQRSPEEQTVTKTLVVGGPTPDGNRYAMLDAPNAPVFVVPTTFVLSAETPPIDLLDRSLLQLDPSRITKFQVSPEKTADAFAIQKDVAGKWGVEGLSFAVDAQRIDQLTGTVSSLPVVRLADYGEMVKWADYGLDKPTTTVTVTLGGEKPVTHTIALGKSAPGGVRYVRVDGGKAVGLIPDVAAGHLSGQKFDYADHTLLTFDPTSLTGLTRKQGKEELELAPATTGVGWEEVKPAKLKADQLYVEELAESLGRLRAERVVAYGKTADVFKQYGLEPPAAIVTVKVGEKPEDKTLRLGNPVDPAKPEGDRYAAVESSRPETSIGVIPAALVSKLLAKEVAFRDHTLAKFVDADKAVLERGDRKITFAKDGVTWKVSSPLSAPAETAELDGFVADLGKLRVDTWVAAKAAGLKEYDLEKPVARWQLFDGERPVLTLLIGKKLTDGRVYVTTDKSELVGLLDAVTSARVLAEYRQRRPWEVDVAQVEAVNMARGDVTFELRKAGTAWVDLTKPGDFIDVRAVNELLGTLGGLRVDRYAADTGADLKLYGLDRPELTITVMLPGGVRKVLEVGAIVGGSDGKQRYARVVDPSRTDVFVLTAADTGRLLRERAVYVMKK